jgi:hypothetical protein
VSKRSPEQWRTGLQRYGHKGARCGPFIGTTGGGRTGLGASFLHLEGNEAGLRGDATAATLGDGVGSVARG